MVSVPAQEVIRGIPVTDRRPHPGDQGNVPSSPTNEGESDEKKEDANPMETADADITALIKSYYKALGEKDIATLKTLEDDFTPSDESKVDKFKRLYRRV